MKITTTDKLPDLNIAGLNRILQIKPDVHKQTIEAKIDADKNEHVTYLHPEQELPLTQFPKYEEVKTSSNDTFLHPAIKSKQNLIDYLLTMLGYPLVTVELRQNHFDVAIGNAIYIFTKYANFPRKYMLKSSLDYVPGVGIDLSKENVVQVCEVQYGLDFSNWGTMLPWMINRTSSGAWGSGNLAGSFITFHNFVEFKKMASRLMSSEPDFQYNKVSKRLVLIPEPQNYGGMVQEGPPPFHSELYPHEDLTRADFRRGIPMVLEVECLPPLEELYQEEYVRKLALAECMILLGQIRGKFEGINLPGGGSVSKEIGAEGKEMKDKLMESLRADTAGMPEIWFA